MRFLIITVTLFAWKCCLCKKQLPNIFAQLAPKNALCVERGLPFTIHYINIVYSKVLQALSIILTNQCDMSKQVLQFGANNDMTK